MREWMLGLAVVATSALVWNAAGMHRQAPLLGAQRMLAQVPELESQVARNPDDTKAVIDLCRAYLERGAPGFALSAIHRASPRVRRDPDVQHAWAEALLRTGHAQEAWEREHAASVQCDKGRCDAWLDGSIRYRKPFLSALRAAGVHDYRRAPGRTVQAFDAVPTRWVRVSTSSKQ